MDIRKLQRAIVDGLEDVKAQDILVFNTEHLSPLFERVIIATGTSNRQTKALASGVRESVKAAGFPVLATEGGDNGEWIIVDCGAAVAHVMQPAIRDYYRLEEIWGGKPVKMKLGVAKTGLVKASEPDDADDAPMAPERKAAARKTGKGGSKAATPAEQAPARQARAQKQPVVVAKPAAKKVVAKKAPARKRGEPAPRTTNAERAAAAAVAIAARAAEAAAAKKAAGKTARKTVAGKTAARQSAAPAAPPAPKVKTIVVKPVARKTAAVKATTGRAPAKKAAARKTPARRG
jgi:ribosome-associated protein